MDNQEEDIIFYQMLNQHKGMIYKIANSYCKAAEDRKDLMQEMIYHLWRSYRSYNHQYSLSTWVYRVVLNVAISFYRKNKHHNQNTTLLSESIIELHEESGNVSQDGNVNLLQQFINALNELDKALMLLYLEEKTYREISEITGLTETNVATKISRIKEKLKKKFLQNK